MNCLYIERKTTLIILLFPALLFLTNKSPCNECQIGKDTLTGKSIYLTYDVAPKCQEGQGALFRLINKTVSIPDSLVTGDYDSRYTVSFIIAVDGKISGARVVHDNTHQIGKQILQAIKSCRWVPGKCHGKKVPVLYKYSIIVDIQKE
jgi:hypothetical protein